MSTSEARLVTVQEVVLCEKGSDLVEHNSITTTTRYGYSHFRHFQNCFNRDGNIICIYMNDVSIIVVTILEVPFSVLKKGGCPNKFVNIVYAQVIVFVYEFLAQGLHLNSQRLLNWDEDLAF